MSALWSLDLVFYVEDLPMYYYYVVLHQEEYHYEKYPPSVNERIQIHGPY